MSRPFGQIRKRKDRPGFRWRFTWKGVVHEHYAGSTLEAAKRKRDRARVLLKDEGEDVRSVLVRVFGQVDGEKVTFRGVAADFLADATRDTKPEATRTLRSRLDVASRAKWAGRYLAEVTSQEIDGWGDDLRKPRRVRRLRSLRDGETRSAFRVAVDRWEEVERPGASVATVNRYRSLVSTVYRWAKRKGYVRGNPAADAAKHSEKGRGRETFLTADECRALVESCPAALAPVVRFALATGMRKGEVLGLRWRDVDLERREAVVVAANAKSKRSRVVGLTTDVHGMLAGMRLARPKPTMDDSDRVFVLRDGEPIAPSAVRSMFDRAVPKCAGIPLAKRTVLRFHDLRHTAASLLVAAGVPIFDVSKILGHSSVAVTMRYAHFAPEAGRRAIDALGAALAGSKPAAAVGAA